ncbi:MAG: P1 family peptidase [Solirubrobacteraceae bacterium]|nr:P1 family peptidase [Patulibacter sp.]
MSSGARALGLTIGSLRAGVHDAITDVDGVLVGHTTLVEGDGALVVGKGPVRTGVSVVLPHSLIWRRPVFAGIHRLNGNGELTGTHWIEESGLLSTAIGLTNTHSVGVVRDALVREHFRVRGADTPFWSMPVVGETWDGVLNDLNGHHVTADHVAAALRDASGGPVAQGAVGGGTGMICHDFKGGIGSASRIVADADGGYTVGVLVQANHGRRERLTIEGVRVGEAIPFADVPPPRTPRAEGTGDGPSISAGAGSIIVILATDAPLLPHQCKRLAQRAALGIGRTGGVGEHYSGDLFLAFATGNRTLEPDVMGATPPHERALRMLDNQYITALFDAAVEATEAAIVNALVSAETTTGRDGITAHALPTDRLIELLGSP